MMRSLHRLQQVDPGFRTEKILMARLSPNWSRYQNLEDSTRFFDALLGRVRAIPGVESAAAASGRPLDGQPPFTNGFRIENIEIQEGELAPQVATRVATPDYFATMGIPLQSGRTFTELDRAEVSGRRGHQPLALGSVLEESRSGGTARFARRRSDLDHPRRRGGRRARADVGLTSRWVRFISRKPSPSGRGRWS